jgi:hypothetical protein
VSTAAREALVDGRRLSMWVAVALAVAAFIYLAVRGPRRAGADQVADLDRDEIRFADGMPLAVPVIADQL